MKFHWGHGIFLFYCLFVLSLVVVVVKSTKFDNSLVTEEYYARDINYQHEYDRRKNSRELSIPVSLEAGDDGGYQLLFPRSVASRVSGTVHFYRPSSKQDDRLMPLHVGDDGVMLLPVDGLKPGKYTAIIAWTADDVPYWDEFTLYL